MKNTLYIAALALCLLLAVSCGGNDAPEKPSVELDGVSISDVVYAPDRILVSTNKYEQGIIDGRGYASVTDEEAAALGEWLSAIDLSAFEKITDEEKGKIGQTLHNVTPLLQSGDRSYELYAASYQVKGGTDERAFLRLTDRADMLRGAKGEISGGEVWMAALTAPSGALPDFAAAEAVTQLTREPDAE